ncbi:MAG: protein BatD [Deltaproteobacteria bacterium]|nr:protein BatD [Deltaproteobacteria bacterium]MBW2661474.1 protein BatD [Deltaproteobacteria bacterium]
MKKAVAAIVFILLSLVFSSLVAAEVSVTLSLDRMEAIPEDSIRMEVSVSGSRSSDTTPVLNGLEDFMVTESGRASRVEVINGKINSGITYTYFIQPRKTGTFKIGPVSIKKDGRTLKSNIATLTVKASSQQSGNDRKPVFIEAAISSQDIYVEQQALYTLKLYRRVNVDNLSLNLPKMEHIVFKQLGKPHEYQTTYAGELYQVLEIRYALLASKEGDYAIVPSKMNMTVMRPGRRSSFDDFFHDPFFSSSSGRPMTVASKPLELKVLALPEKEKPVDFSGLVGDFQIKSRLEPASLKAGESATLTVQVSGQGNVNRIPDINLPEMPFARIYSDQPVLETEQGVLGIKGTKTMKWALVPEKAGRFKTPVLTLSFFNPETGKYNTLNTSAHILSVLPGETQDVAAFHSSPDTGKTAKSPIKKEIQQIGKDILPIHTSANALSVPCRMLSTDWRFLLALIGPLLVYLMLLGVLKLRNQSPERLALSKSRNAFKTLTKRCRQDQPGCADLIDTFKNYLNDKLSLSIGTLTADDAAELLQNKGVAPETAKKMRSLIQRLENAVYAGEDLKNTDAANDLLKLVKTLEKEIR